VGGVMLVALLTLLASWYSSLPWVQHRKWWKGRERMVRHFRKHFRQQPVPPPAEQGDNGTARSTGVGACFVTSSCCPPSPGGGP
jgi:hypothetical protein